MELTLSQLAVRFGCELVGDPDKVVSSLGSLEGAGPESITFLSNPKFKVHLPGTRAGAVLLAAGDAADCPVAALICDNPYTVYARVAQYLRPARQVVPGIHASAVVEKDASVSPTAEVAALSFVGAGARIGERVYIGPGCVVETGASIDDDTRLVGRVYVGERVIIGKRCILHPGCVLGADGFGIAPGGADGWVKVPQLGSVRVGNDVEIGANTTVDRGALEDTVLEDDVRLDNQIMIAHNVHVGAHTAMAGSVKVSGSTHIGRNCLIAGDAGFSGHISVADRVTITARTFVNHSIHEEGSVYSGALPMDEAGNWRRNSARFRQLDKLAKTVKRLDRAAGKREEEKP
jgi:UDP-3-O-[3-hydroxymyristoyl] glucosamine N-acyltransferase